MEPKDIGKKIYTVVFMGRIQYEMFATFIFMKYIVTEYKSKDLRVLFIFSFWSLIQNFIYSHVRDCILSSIKYDLVQRCIKILQGS